MKHGERSADFRVGGPRFLSSHFSYLALDPLYRRGRGDRGAPIKLRPNGLGRWRFVARATYLHGVYAATRPPWRKRVFSRRCEVWRALPRPVDDLLRDMGQTYGYACS